MCRFYRVVPWLEKALGPRRLFYVADEPCVEGAVVVGDMEGREYYYDEGMGEYVCSVEQCYADILTYWEAGPYLVDLLWSKGLFDADKLYKLSGRRGRAILSALVIWEAVLLGRATSWGRFDPYGEDFEQWLHYVAEWTTGYILDDGARERLRI